MLDQMDLFDDGMEESVDINPYSSEVPQSQPLSTDISEHEFSCHCCYDILVNPTTLTCGHNFCRHCLSLWWESSHKNECPECREKWEGFPKVNILLRYAFHSRTISWMNVWFSDHRIHISNWDLLVTSKHKKCMRRVCVIFTPGAAHISNVVKLVLMLYSRGSSHFFTVPSLGNNNSWVTCFKGDKVSTMFWCLMIHSFLQRCHWEALQWSG